VKTTRERNAKTREETNTEAFLLLAESVR